MGNLPPHVPRFEHYTVTRVLGEGGMGVVYEAQDRRTELPVAIKVMSRHRLSDPDLQKRFLKENEILSSLGPNVHGNGTYARKRTTSPVMVFSRRDIRPNDGDPLAGPT